jgi:hypothetical protein
MKPGKYLGGARPLCEKDGFSRLCVDNRGLNKLTTKNKYPLLLTNDMFNCSYGAKVFSKVDPNNVYYHM